MLADLGAGDVGQHEIEQDQIGNALLDAGAGLRAVIGNSRVEAGLLQAELEHLDDVAFVFDDEDLLLGHGQSDSPPEVTFRQQVGKLMAAEGAAPG